MHHISSHSIKGKLFLAVGLFVVIIAMLAIFFLPGNTVTDDYLIEDTTLIATLTEDKKYAVVGNLITLTEEGATLEKDGEKTYFPSSKPIPLFLHIEGTTEPTHSYAFHVGITAELNYVQPAEGEPYIERIVFFP